RGPWGRPHRGPAGARAGGPDVEPELRRDPGHALPPRAPGLERGRSRIEEREVVGDARGAGEEVVLRDEGDARRPRVARRREAHLAAVAQDPGRVGREEPGADRDD